MRKLFSILAALILCTTMWAADEVFYSMTTASSGGPAYANLTEDLLFDGIKWSARANTDMTPWRIGGNKTNAADVDREVFCQAPIETNVTKIEIEHGAGSSSGITVNSMKVEVATDADFSDIVSTLTPTFAANDKVTVTRPSGKDWTDCYYRITYNVKVTASSGNKFLELVGITFYQEKAAPVNNTLYYKGNSSDVDYARDEAVVAIWGWKTGEAGAWYIFEPTADEGILSVELPKDVNNGKIGRWAKGTALADLDWTSPKPYNNTEDIAFPPEYPDTYNMIELTEWSGATSGNWSKYVKVVTPITYTVKVPAGTEKVYIAGDWTPGGDWEFLEMEADGENQFKLDVTDGSKSFQYKYCSAEDWEHVELHADRTLLSDNRTYGDTTDIVELFKDPAWTNLFMKRKSNGWKEEEFVLDAANTTVLKVNYTEALRDSFVIRYGVAAPIYYKVEDGADPITRANCSYYSLFQNAANDIAIDIDQAGEYTFSFGAARLSVTYPAKALVPITYTVKVPAGTEKVYIAGDWTPGGDWEFLEMEADGENQFKYAVTAGDKAFQYKYSAAKDWEHVEVHADRSLLADNRTYGDTTDIVELFKNPAWTNLFLMRKANAWKDEEFEKTAVNDSFVVKVNYSAAQRDSFVIRYAASTYIKIAAGADPMTRESCTDWNISDTEPNDIAIDIDQDGEYTFIYKPGKISVIYPAKALVPITYTVKVPAGTEKVYIAGDWTPGGDWEFLEMEADGENQFKYAVTAGDKSFQYKYCSAEDWEHVELHADRSSLVDNRTYGDTTDIVELFKDPAWTNIYLWRKSNGWTPEEFRKTEVADSLVLTVSYEAAVKDSFLINDNGAFFKTQGDYAITREGNLKMLLETIGYKNVGIDVDMKGDYVFVWNHSESRISVLYPEEPVEDIKYTVKVPDGTEHVYIAGEFNNWQHAEMTKNGDVFELLVTNAHKSDEYKYSASANWDREEVHADRTAVANRHYQEGITDVVELFKDPAWTNLFLMRKANAWNDEEFENTARVDSFSIKVNYSAALRDSFVMKMAFGGMEQYIKIAADASPMTRNNCTHWGVGYNLPNDIAIDIDQDGEYTFCLYEDGTDIRLTVIYPEKTTPTPNFFITGNEALVGAALEWHADAIPVMDADSYTFENLPADTEFQLKVTVDGTFSTSKGYDDLTVKAAGLSGNTDGNIVFKLATAGDVKVTYNSTTFTVEGDFVKPVTQYGLLINGSEFLAAWLNPASPTHPNEELMITNVSLNEGDKFVLHDDGPSKANWVIDTWTDTSYKFNIGKDAADKQCYEVTETGVYDFYVYSTLDGVDNYIHVNKQSTTYCENVYGEGVEIRKVMLNNVLYIIRDGKIYNVQGTLVR